MKAIKLLLTLWFCTSGFSVEASTSKQLDDLFNGAVEAVGFSGTVLINKRQDVIFLKSYGYADKAQKTLLTPEYVFSPGSIAKQFSSIALIKLKQEGKIDFSQKVSAFIPQLPSWAQDVTVEQLLTHTSGLPDIKYRKNMTTQQALRDIQGIKSLEFPAGSEFLYSNNNTLLRALIIEKAAGMHFEDYLAALFKQIGMRHSLAIDGPGVIGMKVAKGAKPFMVKGISALTSVQDLLLWQQALWSGKIISKALMKDAVLTQSLGGKGRSYYDFGYYTTKGGKLVTLEHDGTHPSHYSLVKQDFRRDLQIVLLSNDGRKQTLYELRNAIESILQGDKAESRKAEVADS